MDAGLALLLTAGYRTADDHLPGQTRSAGETVTDAEGVNPDNPRAHFTPRATSA